VTHETPRNEGCSAVERGENDKARPDNSEASGSGETPLQCVNTEPVRVTDVTFVPTRAGVAHVCFIIDVFSRNSAGRRVGRYMWTETVLDAMEMARWSRRQQLLGLRCHSDAGTVCASADFRALVRPGDALIRGPYRRVLEQQRGGIVLFDPQRRACLADRVRHQTTRSQRPHPPYRGVLQQSTPALSCRLPTPERSPL
jgi:transposase InsO family protein